MEWTYKNELFTSSDDYVGFVYIITNLVTNRKYVGKKTFKFTKYRFVKKKRKKYFVESDWKTYWSSSEDLKADVLLLGEQNFKREIIHLCKSKGMMSYLEAREQFDRRVLESDEWYNGYIMVRCNKKHLK